MYCEQLMKKVLLLTSLLPLSMLFGATTSAWIADPTGDWGVGTNWDNGVPNAQDDVADLSSSLLTADPTITLTLTSIAPTVGTVSFYIFNSADYTIAGPNALTFSASSGTANLLNGNAGTLNTISAAITLTSNLSIQNSSNTALTLSGVISGSSGITVANTGTGPVVFSGANTFTGGLTITSGTLQCGALSTLPATVAVTMGGGTLDLNNFAQTIGGLNGTGTVTNVVGSATLTVNTTASNSFAGTITGGGGLTIGGSGSLTLTTPNTYTGTTTLTSGTLQSGVNNALPASPFSIASGIFNLNNFNQALGSVSGTGGSINLGTGQLTVTPTSSTNFAGVISGSGPVIFTGGANTWRLNAAQAYTGLTTINSGTIELGIANGLPANGPITMTGGTIALNSFSQTTGTLSASAGSITTIASEQLIVAPTAPAIFSGVISGSGSVVFQGPFSWIMQVPQTYTGGTTINGGILEMGVANALAPTGPVTVNNPGTLQLNNNNLAIASLSGNGAVNLGSGILTLNTTTTTAFSGSIFGSGALSVLGSGTQILTGPNSYTGGTTIGGTATLQGTTSSLQGAIVNNSTLFFNQTFNGTYGGPLSGAGQLLIAGGGTVTLSGTPVQGSTVVLGGALDIAPGTILTSPVSVSSGGSFGGFGTIVGAVNNGGILNPGTSTALGTLSVIGPVTFQPGSSYVANLTPTGADLLAVTGLVTIQPGSNIVIDAQRGEYEEETRFAIITSSLPVAGQFSGFQLTNPFLEAQLLYNQLLPGSVEIDLQIKNLSDVIVGGNAGAIAACITQAHMRQDEDLENIVSDIIFFSVEEVRKLLDEMQPSQLRALTVAEQENTFFAQQQLNWRMAEFERSTCERDVTARYPWNLWVSLVGNWTDQRESDHNVGYNAPTIGLMTGFDGRIAENLYLGLAAEYAHVFFDWKSDRGHAIINRCSAGPYVSYIGKAGYVNASVLGSFAHFHTHRHIPFLERTASSTHNGETLLPHLEAGLILHPSPDVTFSPFGTVDYLFGWEDGFQETGAESMNFKIASSTSRMFRSELGLKISKCSVRSHTKWVHDLKASWVYENRLHGKDLSATFRQFPCTFTVEGLFPSRSFIDLGMGLTFLFKKDRFATSLRYEGQFGEGVTLQSIIAQHLTRF
jgi:autotransporter-associated beta strand protein